MNHNDKQPMPFTAVSYDTEGAVAASGVSKTTIQAAVVSKELVAHYIGRKPVFRAVDLDAWIRSLPTESPAERRRTA